MIQPDGTQSFEDAEEMLVRAAIKLINRACRGRVIVVIGCDADGREWLVPAANVPPAILREALSQNFDTTLRVYEENHT